ncbi:unnamed protein product [Adineta ricciae]|uniref:F-box domain-containing protein n=1 Tax=Adineta ricciae TaxID=249248 RepID=A0A815LWY6_ADIRI|nr:unnamed protein product [Adineta ricciae]CAF1415874.1 unnamed protein product [Adineta ricciae]
MSTAIERLPTETLHQILDNLDVETIVISLRQVCRRFRSVMQSYNRYVFEFRQTSKSNLSLIYRLVRPESVISLVLSDDRTPGQVSFFFSLPQIHKFSRLQSLVLRDIHEPQVVRILRRIKLDQLKSVVIKIDKYDGRRRMTTVNFLRSVVSQPNLRKLDLQINSRRFHLIQWSRPNTLRDLSIDGNMDGDHLYKILQCSPLLQTLKLRQGLPLTNNWNKSICFPTLTSLTLDEISIDIDELQSFLLFTPRLAHLKVIGSVDYFSGTEWEQFIQIHLPMLNQFEIFLLIRFMSLTSSQDAESIIGPLRSPFWIEHKKWFFTCEQGLQSCRAYLYSLPSCQSTMKYIIPSQRILLSTLPPDSSTMDNMKNLTVALTNELVDELLEKKPQPVLLNTIKLLVDVKSDRLVIPLVSLTILVDLSHLVEIEFGECYPILSDGDFDVDAFSDMKTLLRQAPNLSSLLISDQFAYGFGLSTMDICYLLSRQIKHLQLPVSDLNDIKLVLEQCQYLSTVRFTARQRKLPTQIVRWIDENTTGSTCRKNADSVQVWLGKNNIESSEPEATCKRPKLSSGDIY